MPRETKPARVVFLLQDLEFGGTQRQGEHRFDIDPAPLDLGGRARQAPTGSRREDQQTDTGGTGERAGIPDPDVVGLGRGVPAQTRGGIDQARFLG